MNMVVGQQLGRVIVAQRVLETVVEVTALKVPGVVRVAPYGRRTVHVTVEGNTVRADIGIIVAADRQVSEVSTAVRQRIAAAIERLLGMEAKEVNVFVRDVEGAGAPGDSSGGQERDRTE